VQSQYRPLHVDHFDLRKLGIPMILLPLIKLVQLGEDYWLVDTKQGHFYRDISRLELLANFPYDETLLTQTHIPKQHHHWLLPKILNLA
jgi:hypothetical protein